MKRLYLCLMAFAVIALASCGGHSADKLSKEEILKQCNKNLVEMGLDSSVVTIKIGYYEENDPYNRLQLEKLKAAGIVNYDVERFAWWETKKEKKTIYHNVDYYYTWTGAYAYTKKEASTKWVTSYEYDEHFMVNVSLTDNAQKYALGHKPSPKLKEEEDHDFKQPIYYDSLYPENKINQLSENWPEVPHPLAEEVYKKCKGILAETQALLDQVIGNNYSKPEQKLNTLDKVDNYDCMTTVQKSEIKAEREGLQQRIDVLKGNEAYEKSKKIIEEANTILNNAKTCKDVTKAVNKSDGTNYVNNKGLMNSTQSADISSLMQNIKTLANQKVEEFGCNQPADTPQYSEPEYVEEEPAKENRDPQAIAYEEAQRKQNSTDAILFAYVKKAIVARNVRIGQDSDGTTASAEVIYKISKVTDAARVLNRSLNDTRIKDNVSFTYYNDKGWVINKYYGRMESETEIIY